MKKKILVLSISLILLSVVVTSYVSVQMNLDSLLLQKETEIQNYCQLINGAIAKDIHHGLQVDYNTYAKEFSGEIDQRVTFVDETGRVLGDSLMGDRYTEMGNHAGRQEIQQAIQQGVGKSNRSSETLGSEYLYVAASLTDGGELICITRVAMEIHRLDVIGSFLIATSLKAAGVGILIAILFSIPFAGRITRPIKSIVKNAEKIAAGDYAQRVEIHTGDELEELGSTINHMSEKLALSVEEMQRAETIRKEFVANVTHELKTPLTSISGFVETLQDGADENPEIRRKFLDIIAVETVRLKRLINDILVISDIESGKEARMDLDISVREVMEEIVEFLHPQLEEKQIAVEQKYAYEIYIGGNRDRFKQMMLNLVENAVKYSDEEGCILVEAKKSQGKVFVSVTDHGPGIAEADLPRIFERFYRVDKSRSQKVGGTGLGLSIVKHIAALFEGEVKVTSRVGEGSTFTVVLPE